uniref:Ricin B lectin domain-containing protein n=1 Tax=Araucaria cunninghamii TaxID=56994 RepID=A0A0D6R3H6_ARACU
MVPAMALKALSMLLVLSSASKWAACSPLYASSRWIVDKDGSRVKLACVNWASHVDIMVAEGLDRQPLDAITTKIGALGFNCVRLTWALYMFTDTSLGATTIRQSLRKFRLSDAENGMETHNPDLLDLSVLEVYKRVVSRLGSGNVMVILDNHISRPGWCCSNSDGNGFFGDKDFNPYVWINGLTTVASTFNGTSQVVGMSLRNELRGPRQNQDDWYKYMQMGAEAVHRANPYVLVILSGLSFDTNLNFLSRKAVSLNFKEKLVFEMHWYAFSDGQAWANGNPNEVCGSVTSSVMNRGGFLITPNHTYTAPLFISEFGINQMGTNVNDNRYINCFLAFAAEYDVDWAYWALEGSYYIRSGTPALDETYGLLAGDWRNPRNASFLARLSAIQQPFQGPGLSECSPYQMVFHPATGMCLQRYSLLGLDIILGPCTETDAWRYTEDKTMMLKGTNLCIQAHELGKKARLGIVCAGDNTKWEMISSSKLHLTTTLENGSRVCLDGSSSPSVMINECKCLSGDSSCDPGNQWFKIITTTRDMPLLSSIHGMKEEE